MEEKEILSVLHQMFERTLPILQTAKEGFKRENGNILKEQSRKFAEIMKSSLPFFEGLVQKKDKDEVEKKAVEWLVITQMIGSAMENLFNKMVLKAEADVLFSEKAKKEISELIDELETELRDLKDFIITKNPELKKKVGERAERIVKMANEFDSAHQKRLITGICMPKASYIYIDMTNSLRKIVKEMKRLAERV